jgi:hypothetical protein
MYRIWFGRIFTFDGVLPLMVWLTPWLASIALPNRRGLIEILAVLLPVMGFLVRYFTGRRLIDSNFCSLKVRRCQFASLCVGLVLLGVIDCVIVLLYVMPRGAFDQLSDWVVFLLLGSAYFLLMAGAMYPGRLR